MVNPVKHNGWRGNFDTVTTLPADTTQTTLEIFVPADSATLAVGAAREAGGATGIGGSRIDTNTIDSGAIYLY